MKNEMRHFTMFLLSGTWFFLSSFFLAPQPAAQTKECIQSGSCVEQLLENSPECVRLDSNQRIGLVYQQVERIETGYRCELIYARKERLFVRETIKSFEDRRLPAIQWGFIYDGDGHSHVFCRFKGRHFHFLRTASGWEERDLTVDLKKAFPSQETVFFYQSALTDRKSGLRVLYKAFSKGKSARWAHGTWDGQQWIVRALDGFSPQGMEQVFGIRQDDCGNLHALYSLERNLYYARYEKGEWHEEVVLKRKNFDTEAAWDASLSLDSGGVPFAVSTLIQRGSSGSFLFARPLFHSRVSRGDWKNVSLAVRSEGYQGTDGDSYTGGFPRLEFDAQGCPHVCFTDIASWHSRHGNEWTYGALRYASRQEEGWRCKTVMKQTGQKERKKPLEQFLHPVMRVSPDGKSCHFVGVEKVTNSESIFHDPTAPSRFRLIYRTSFPR